MLRIAARNAQWENRRVRSEFPKKKQAPRGERRREEFTRFGERNFEISRNAKVADTRNNRTPGSVVRVPNVQTKTAANAGRA